MSKLERIYHGNKVVPANELLKWCMTNGITVHFHAPNPHKDKSTASAYINLGTTQREDKFLPILKAMGWKHYHYPPSHSIYKSVGFEELTF